LRTPESLIQMLKPRIIPCLDVKDGRVVKGINFINLVDAGDPVEQAKHYNDCGADEICFLDIEATKDNKKTMIDVIKKTADQVFIPLTIGGGIRSVEDIREILLAGADKVCINTAGILEPKLIRDAADRFGNQCIVVAVDFKFINNKWEVYSHGGTQKTGLDAVKWIREIENLGAGELLLTSMDRDGTKLGFDIEFLNNIRSLINLPIIASGGAGKLGDFEEAIEKGGASAVLAASVFHFGLIKIPEVKEYLIAKNIPMRI